MVLMRSSSHAVLMALRRRLESQATDPEVLDAVQAFYGPAERAAELLDKVSPGWREAINGGRTVVVRVHTFRAAVTVWLEGMTDEEYCMAGFACMNARDAASSRSKLAEALQWKGEAGQRNVTKTVSQMVDRVLRRAFGICLGERRGKTPRCEIDTGAYRALEEYKCGCLASADLALGFVWIRGDEMI